VNKIVVKVEDIVDNEKVKEMIAIYIASFFAVSLGVEDKNLIADFSSDVAKDASQNPLDFGASL